MTAALRAASEAERRGRDAHTFEAWGRRLTQAQYFAREARLRGHVWAREAMRTWLWEDDGQTLASCETFEVPSVVGEAPGRSWVVASVYVEPTLRRHGHAVAMMRALLERLRGESGAQAVTLYSEVGEALYARVGFQGVLSFDVCFEAGGAAPGAVQWAEDQLPLPVTRAPEAGQLRLRVTSGQVAWQLERERFYAEALARGPLRVHGARLGPASIGWTASWRDDELLVLWLDAPSDDDVVALVQAARWVAADAGLARVRVWETRPLPPRLGGLRAVRDDALAMVAPLGAGVDAWVAIERALWA